MDLKVGNLPVPAIHVGSTPVKSVYVGSKLVWSATVQITLDTGWGARNQLLAALTARGLSYWKVTEIPFEIELVGSGSVQSMFDGCAALTTVPRMNTSNVTDMRSMFNDCTSLTSVPQMNTSNVTSMEGMFSGCAALVSVPDMDTSNVTSMAYMFSNCVSLTTAPEMDTSKVTTMSSMFDGCAALTYVPEMDTRNVTDTNYMLYGCSSLTDGNVRLYGKHPQVVTWDMITASGLTKEPFIEVVQITLDTGYQAQRSFRDALSARGLAYRTVKELPFDIELVGTGATQSMFDGCRALTSVPRMNTSNVTNMTSMFYNCAALTSVPAMDTSSVTSMERMFYGCSSLTSVPAMDTSQVTSAYQMFRNCSSLTDDNVRLIVKNPSVSADSMISGSGLTKEPFYATDRLPNPPAPRVVTISKQGYTSQWDTSSATGDVSLIQEWTSNGKARFAAYVTCNEDVNYSGNYMTQKSGAVIPSGVDVEPAMRNVYTFTEVI